MPGLYRALWPLLQRTDPESAHHWALRFWRAVGRWPWLARAVARATGAHDLPADPVVVAGVRFRNRVGLAAGYDKDGLAWRGLAALGFGHIEIGTVTPRAQPGNPRPRMWRVPERQALINHLGFPSRGAAFVLRQLQGERPSGLVLGVNLGKNHATPNARAEVDYILLTRVFAPVADYLVVNVSCPNMEDFRELQNRRAVQRLVRAVVTARSLWQAQTGGARPLPVFVKLAPDFGPGQLESTVEGALLGGADGFIATNTTTQRPGLGPRWRDIPGGLSGAPLRDLSTQLIRRLAHLTQGRVPIIGVGGILSPADAQAKLDAGAALVQVFTGLVYRGPGLVPQIVRALAQKRGRDEQTTPSRDRMALTGGGSP